MIEVGTEVERHSDKGTVVEVSGERCRVYWHTYVGGNRTPKRTWVNRKFLKVVPKEAPCS